MLHVQAPLACKYDKNAAPKDVSDTGRFSFVAKGTAAMQVLLRGDEHSVLPLLGFAEWQVDFLPLAVPLVAANPADIDRDHPIAAQRLRSDTNFADKFSKFNGQFGSRKKRTKPVGELVTAKQTSKTAKPIVVQDGHLCASTLSPPLMT